MKAKVANMRKDIDYVMFFYFTSLIQLADNLDALENSMILRLPPEKDTIGIQ